MKILLKEWHQQKWWFLFGCLAGVAFPAFECYLWCQNNQTDKIQTSFGSGIVACIGAFYAIILAIATTHHDTKKGTDDFWRSKPVHIWKLLAVKFIFGGCILFISFLFVMSLDFWSRLVHNEFPRDAWRVFCYTYPIALFMFAATMCLLVVLRDSAKTVLLAIWLALLIYFVPLLIGSLDWMNVFEQIDNSRGRPSLLEHIVQRSTLSGSLLHRAVISSQPVKVPVVFTTTPQIIWQIITSEGYLQYLLFLGVTVSGAIGVVVLSAAAFKRNWRWQPGQKTIVWAMGLSAAFIFGIAILQVGHNLEPVKEWNGRKIVNPVIFSESHVLDNFQGMGYFYRRVNAVGVKDDLMIRVSHGCQTTEPQKFDWWKDKAIVHFVVQLYRFPFYENSKIPVTAGMKTQPDFAAGGIKLFSTNEPVEASGNHSALGCFVRGNYLYAAYRPEIRERKGCRTDYNDVPLYFATVDINNPEQPKLIGNIQIEQTHGWNRGFASYGDYCYLNDGGQLVIISVAKAGQPEIVKRIQYDSNAESIGLGCNPWLPSEKLIVAGDRLLCCSRSRIVILDLGEPAMPKVIFDEQYNKQYNEQYVEAAAYKDNCLYVSNSDGLYFYRLIKQADGRFSGELAGERKATPLEKLAGRKPFELLFYNGYLVEASDGFGMIVYDISNPEIPKRVYHAGTDSFCSDMGIWNGLIYLQSYGFEVRFFDIPGKN